MQTNNQTRKLYRAIGHKLNPVLIISNGLSDNIAAELERALEEHELIKIRVNAADREEKQEILDAICTVHGAELIQLTGHIALLHRKAKKQNRELSNLVRYAT
ncbi:MAG TPA: YhbY family RNA-binding protein [Candidatus Acidoferrum sp.]|nr:YhbY family RNA-binding protein [Candidatus Acidoferrum sp.]